MRFTSPEIGIGSSRIHKGSWLRRLVRHRETQAECGAGRGWIKRDGGLEHLSQLLADCQPQAGARVFSGVAGVHLPELLKDEVLHVHWDAGTGVRDDQLDSADGRAFHHAPTCDRDRPSGRSELDCVGNEVVEDLLNLARIRLQCRKRWLDVGGNANGLGCRLRRHDSGDSLDQIGHAGRLDRHFHPASLDFGHAQQLVDHFQQGPTARRDVVEIPKVLLIRVIMC